MSNNNLTRKFYRDYKKIHAKLYKNIKGIPEEDKKKWYSSLMLSRLMITYFMQKEELLDNNINYLEDKYKEYHEDNDFHKRFLLTLFHRGFNIPIKDRSNKAKYSLGNVPYLDGGIFEKHYIEQKNQTIKINNEVFKKIIETFDKYVWTLDNKNQEDQVISPQILGYILEKYINQKEKGAYYTKADTTEYISKYTIIPNILDKLQNKYHRFFERNGFVFNLIKENPNEYIHFNFPKNITENIPAVIRQGFQDYSKRNEWNDYVEKNSNAKEKIWREYLDKLRHFKEVLDKIENNNIKDINDLITYNLKIKKIIKDVIKNGNQHIVKEIYFILAGNEEGRSPIRILDPACGSGAFLISALEILEPIYESCINRMKVLLEQKKADQKNELLFYEIWKEIRKHKNLKYYIYKEIIKNNLYGVDIMSEAVEISKMRLMLRLISLVDNYDEIETLPHLENKIVSGNSLVGYKSFDEFNNENKKISYQLDEQESYRNKKKLDKFYAKSRYRIKEKEVSEWKKNNKPLHWINKFHDIMKYNKGFDCVIGNPPYIEYYTVRDKYEVKNFKSIKCNNLAAYLTERGMDLLNHEGNMGFIVPISIVSTPRMSDLRNLISNKSQYTYYANFADRPGTLFEGVHQKLTIMLTKKQNFPNTHYTNLYTSKYYHWYSNVGQNERENLFEEIEYVNNPYNKYEDKCILKLGKNIDLKIWNKLQSKQKDLYSYFEKSSDHKIYLSKRMTFWTKCFLKPKKSNEFQTYYLDSAKRAKIIMAILNSNVYFYFWEIVSDCWHITNKELKMFKIDLDNMDNITKNRLAKLAIKLEDDLEKNKVKVNTKQTDYEYKHRNSKVIIDKIDILLANHYQLTKEELDYIINYNIKYRMSGKINIDDEGYEKNYRNIEEGNEF